MNRRGFLGSLAALAIAPVAPKSTAAPWHWTPAAWKPLDVTRVDVFEGAAFEWKEVAFGFTANCAPSEAEAIAHEAAWHRLAMGADVFTAPRLSPALASSRDRTR